jgi:putative transcriptional regulator
MVKYHPEARFLTDYSAGSLPVAQALCVATHLHYCAGCRVKVRELTELGSQLFQQLAVQQQSVQQQSVQHESAQLQNGQAPATQQADSFARLIERVETLPALPPAAKTAVPKPDALPRPLHRLAHGNIDSLSWRRIGKGFRYSKLKTGDHTRETTLFHIKAGGNVPHHRHVGDEITVVIKGSFSDQDDKYNVGDFIVRTAGEQHSPVASQDGDCLCLSTLDKPIVISNLFYRLLAPLL